MNNTHDHWFEKFRQISRDYSDASVIMHEVIAGRAGLTGADHKYLGLIIKKGEATAGDIAHITGLTTGAVTGLIDRLEKKGLVHRAPDKQDRRKVVIIPQLEKTMSLLGPVFSDLQEKTKDLISTFSHQEREVIERYFIAATQIMHSVTNNLRKKEK
ncbi:MarR family transcriptional regulator [Fulvivirga ulvae]|uniref:MarR family winged helix-turn-helix transcriptional regulator n=1 Tax=Fulvivirga ulvae TaxID=2904245 RepID=UPI001F476042|nr:MarR family transcriptional regulator [Fulvivirga ulvae]UII30672.1 MarR family transcriptional regulator [Fulvivirga ulvae]